MEACGMRGFRFHDLRHTFRTLGAEAGVPLEVMMAQLGHMDRETSLEYVHIQQRALERAKQLIESEQEDVLATAEGRPIETTERSEDSPRRARPKSRPQSHRSHRSNFQPRQLVCPPTPARIPNHNTWFREVPPLSGAAAGTMPSPGMPGPEENASLGAASVLVLLTDFAIWITT